MVEKARRELDEHIQDIGEETTFDLGIIQCILTW